MKGTLEMKGSARKQAEDDQSRFDLQERIRVRAYELYERRGRDDGHELDDWLTAESEVTGGSESIAA